MANAPGESTLNAGGFQSSAPIDRSASGLQYQTYQMGLNAKGAALGMGRRVAPEANQMFSNPPISGGQFAEGHAKSVATFGGEGGE